METYKNPILPGFYPDPSICRVNEDYYLVTSTFEYFPGVPIFTSKDLVNWKQVGHVLDRPSQLDLCNSPCSRGIWAPTIRHNSGTFYMCTTNMLKKPRGESDIGGHFIVTAENPVGPWSDPFWLDDAPGIDPSLFFDDDGRVYFMATCYPHDGAKYKGNNEIWLQEIDVKEMKLIGERFYLWQGALEGAAMHTEGPHIYKRNSYYYLLVAEGGTGYKHAATAARSKNITGPYENNPRNPLITHRNMRVHSPITNVGHGDLVQTQNDEWWMVLLGSRPYGGPYRNLGRETFMVPIIWEDDWPVASPETGRVEFEHGMPLLKEHIWDKQPDCDNFNKPELDLVWNFLRTPRDQFWSLSERPGFLRLKLRPQMLSECVNPGFIGRRQQHINFSAQLKIEFSPESENETAGIVILQNNEYHFRMEIGLADNTKIIKLTKREKGCDEVIDSQVFDLHSIILQITAKEQDLSFAFGADKNSMQSLADSVNGRILSTEVAGGFVGTYLGMYASSNRKKSSNFADFDWFEYKGM